MTRQLGSRLTYDDLAALPEDRFRHELIDGQHFMTPSPFTNHQRASARLFVAIHDNVERTSSGEVFYAPFDVVFSDYDVVEPDILYISNERSSIITEKNIQGAPDLVVEVLSPGTRRRDRTLKRDLYERFGVLEYWLVDPRSRSVTVYRRQDPKFGEPEELTADTGDHLSTPLLPGFEIPLVEIFAE